MRRWNRKLSWWRLWRQKQQRQRWMRSKVQKGRRIYVRPFFALSVLLGLQNRVICVQLRLQIRRRKSGSVFVFTFPKTQFICVHGLGEVLEFEHIFIFYHIKHCVAHIRFWNKWDYCWIRLLRNPWGFGGQSYIVVHEHTASTIICRSTRLFITAQSFSFENNCPKDHCQSVRAFSDHQIGRR